MQEHHGLTTEEQDALDWDRWRELAVEAVALNEMRIQRDSLAVALGIAKAFGRG